MRAVIVIGTQWGDEGKGKVIDLLSEKADFIVRAQGGNNAGHTIVVGKEEYRFHLVPSGVLYPHTQCCITGGTVIDPKVFLDEIARLESQGVSLKNRLHVSLYAHVIFPYHRLLDNLYEEQKGEHAIGTTGRGIGPCYMDKAGRVGIRICELIDPSLLKKRLGFVLELKNRELKHLFGHPPLSFDEVYAEYVDYGKAIAPLVSDVEMKIADAVKAKKKILCEGAHGSLLDTTFGTYPYVTSSSTISAGVSTGAGIGASVIDHTIGVVKVYTTRVGAGPLPTALSGEEEQLFMDHSSAREIGTTTGRKRRMGWFDACLVRYSVNLSGVDSLALTKLDILDHLAEIKICTGYKLKGSVRKTPPACIEDLEAVVPIYETMPGWKRSTKDVTSIDQLPKEARRYVDRLAELTEVPISILSVGPERHRTLFLNEFFT